MGCVNSKTDINDTHPNIFHVINVNDRGRPYSRGKLEVTETELILHQKGKNPIKWPLRSLRKYGWDVDTDVFSIECGRRSPTGPGYYAFKCRKAEQLFNMVQQYIIGGVQEHIHHPNVDNTNQNIDFSVIGGPMGPPVQRRLDAQATGVDSGHLNPVQSMSRSHTSGFSRPGSISSNGGQLSPTTISPPPIIAVPSVEHNNNKRSSSIIENGIGPPNYANLGPDTDSTCHVYMNVDTKEIVNSLSQNNFIENREYQREVSEEVHCYANVDTRDVDSLQLLQQQHSNILIPNNSEIVQMYMSNSVPCTPTAYNETDYMIVREVNYAELDLDSAKNNNGNYLNEKTGTTIPKPTTTLLGSALQESTSLQKKSYATIDFPKTIALSQSINPKAEMEEGSRKTRHNSTINSFSD
ncbi:unnamed protein product [Ceutorhynchus assimilis]|uniref:IRS-type PTB domain-containing protein n=1 Tax=Ceutorhynchus assimilis TaxID=467358 RepID=A0A9N9MC29_9CUCU|nr:unnamed protein product [Ceutorhynchus assimilis]